MGKGEITVDSTVEESVIPKEWNKEFELREVKEEDRLKLQNASGGKIGGIVKASPKRSSPRRHRAAAGQTPADKDSPRRSQKKQKTPGVFDALPNSPVRPVRTRGVASSGKKSKRKTRSS